MGHPGKPTRPSLAPHDVWSADGTGHFTTGDGLSCYPLTVADGSSRLRLGCQALSSPRVLEATPVCTRVFKAFELPKRIRLDTGWPLATTPLARLSQLSAWWVRLGLLPEGIEPGQPQPTGRHECLHRTLKAATTHPPAPGRTFDRFRQAFTFARPPEARELQTPASLEEVSPREGPTNLPPLASPDRFAVCDGRANGGLRGTHPWVNGSHPCAGDSVCLEDIADGLWPVAFGPLNRGRRLARPTRREAADGKLTQHR
jgi:putative transposase